MVATDEDEGGNGIYVVMAGLVKSSYKIPDGDTQVTPSTQPQGWGLGVGGCPWCHNAVLDLDVLVR